MSLVFAAVLIVSALISTAILVIAVPALLAFVAFDVATRHEPAGPKTHDAILRIAQERGVARAFVILGGAFWSVVLFTGWQALNERGLVDALMGASIPIIACAATLVIGWYYERVASALLALGSLAVVAWGVIFQFEPVVWAIMVITLIGPMATASALFWMARREQESYEHAMAVRPELATIFAARSTLEH